MERTLFLALLLTACTGPANSDGSGNPGHNIDGGTNVNDDTGEMSDVTFTSPITYAERSGDEIVTNEVATDGIAFTVKDADKATWAAETIYTDSLVLGKCTATVDHTDAYGVHWVSDTVNIDSAAVELKPCVDLTGTWACYDVGDHEDNVDDVPFEMTNCLASNPKDGSQLQMDGNHFTSDHYDGFVSQDGLQLDLNRYGNTGTYFGITYCDKQ